MFVPFDSLLDHSRIWIYQSDRKLKQDDKEIIETTMVEFLEQWKAHGVSLKASFKLCYDRFIILAVDNQYAMASGCSIDASVGIIRKLGQELNIDFFDRTKICFMIDEETVHHNLDKIKLNIENKNINKTTLTFNNLITEKWSLSSKWLLPLQETWMQRYLIG